MLFLRSNFSSSILLPEGSYLIDFVTKKDHYALLQVMKTALFINTGFDKSPRQNTIIPFKIDKNEKDFDEKKTSKL